MPLAVLEPPATTDEVRDRAGAIHDDLEDALRFEAHEADEERANRIELREHWFEKLRASVIALSSSEAWLEHELKTELLLSLESLRAAIDVDPDAEDPDLHQREALKRMQVVVEAMLRQLEHEIIDQPERAACLVATELQSVGDQALAELLSTTPRMLAKYRAGVSEIRKHPDRTVLLGQLVYELRGSRTPRGVLMWFDAPREQLGGRAPRELIDEDPRAAYETLIALARGARGQLDAGSSGALD
jgi:hypothetical protein